MIYNEFGKPIEEVKADTRAPMGVSVFPEDSDRYSTDASRALTPAKVDSILSAASQGNISEQSKLALELQEKNWDIGQAIETRRNAVLGVPWTVEPGDDTPAAKKAAETLKAALDAAGGPVSYADTSDKLDSFANLCEDMLSAIIPGFAVSEIVWKAGGEIAGFKFLEQRNFMLGRRGELRLIVTNEPDGVALPPRKFVVNQYRRRGSDIARSGLVRTLAWLHCFQRLPFADLLRFVERYGMPFAVAKVDQNSWDNERNVLKSLIRNFGPDGGGVFTRAVEIELLQAANNTGDVYFKLLEYTRDAITKLILGQLASSDKSAGLSGGDAQSQVRQDILAADCSVLGATLTADLAKPWNDFNSPAGTACPKIVFHCEPAEDLKAMADTVKVLFDAGLETDEKKMSEKFGMTLKRKAAPAQPAMSTADAVALSAEGKQTTDDRGQMAAGIDKWASPLIQKINAVLESDPSTGSGLSKLSGLSFDDFNGAALEDFLGTSAVMAAAQGKLDAAEKVGKKLKR